MTINLKSNNAYAGASTLTNVDVLTKSASDIYDAYAARVTADGGTVGDAAACEAVIQSALDGGYFYRIAAAVSPKWGRKVSGSNITKLYSLRGTIDAVITGTVPLDTTTVVGEHLAEIGSGDSFSFTGLTVLATGATGLAVLGVDYATVSGSILQTTFTPAAEAWALNNGLTFHTLAVAGVAKFTSNPEYAGVSLAADLMQVDMVQKRVIGIRDGVQMKVLVPAFTAIAEGATATVAVTRTGASPYLAERWIFNDAGDMPGVLAMMAASFDAGARH